MCTFNALATIGVTITWMIHRFDKPFMMYVCDNFFGINLWR